jgi:carbamate kinase
MKETEKPTLLVALGGNALMRKGEEGTVPQQFKNLAVPIRQIARLSQDQQESCREVPKLPLEILVAQTQGQIGYMIESTLDSELMDLGIHVKPLVSLITYVVVNKNDPAFSDPSKPIGPAYKRKKDAPSGYSVRKTAKGFRRVVVSPKPVTIIEKREIKKLINADFIVICCGGGGIPVKREGRAFQGVDAVIDKDLASAKLAEEVGVDIFLIATDVPGVALNFGTPDQRFLRNINLQEAERYLKEGRFPAGSMAPKIEACIQFIRGKGNRAVITSIEEIDLAIQAKAGTEIKV